MKIAYTQDFYSKAALTEFAPPLVGTPIILGDCEDGHRVLVCALLCIVDSANATFALASVGGSGFPDLHAR